MKYIKHPLWWAKYWYRYHFKRSIRIRYLKWKRNRGRPEDHYVTPKINEYNHRFGPYKNSIEFDSSFDEVPGYYDIGGGKIWIRYPWDE